MSNNFEITLRSKSAEQLVNMSQNSDSWTGEQLRFINAEIKKRGLEVFEEPEPWDEAEMDELNTDAPQTDFEKNMSVIMAHEQNEKANEGIKLAAQIVSASAMMVVFLLGLFGMLNNYILITVAVMTAFVSLGLSISKLYLIALVVGGVSLLIDAAILLMYVRESL